MSGTFFRVLFGSTNLFIFHHPKDEKKQKNENKVVPAPSYDSAHEEIAMNSELGNLTGKDAFSDDILLYTVLVLASTDAGAYHSYKQIIKI